MGFDSMPKPKAGSEDNKEEQQDQGGAKKWLETTGKNGEKVSIGVFGNETDADAMARAKEIDDRLDREGKSESSLS